MENKITPGCWIEVENIGKAVCVEIQNANKYADDEKGIYICGEGRLYCYRYEAIKCSSGKTIWVYNASFEEYVKYLNEPDDISLNILNLSGPYGEV